MLSRWLVGPGLCVCVCAQVTRWSGVGWSVYVWVCEQVARWFALWWVFVCVCVFAMRA